MISYSIEMREHTKNFNSLKSMKLRGKFTNVQPASIMKQVDSINLLFY